MSGTLRSFSYLYFVFAALIVFLIGLYGYYETCSGIVDRACPTGFGGHVLATLALYVRAGQMPAAPHFLLRTASYLAPFTIWLVALGTGIAIVINNLRHDARVVMARHKRDHVIVCGLGDTGMQTITNLRDARVDIVAIDRVDDSPYAVSLERQRIPVLKGNAGEPSVLRPSGLNRARAVVVCTGEDADNIDIAFRARDTYAGHKRLLLLVELRDPWLFTKLLEHDKESLNTPKVELRLFNIYQNASRLLIRSLCPQPARGAPLFKPFIIIGFGNMGREVAMHVVRACPVSLDQPVELTIFDRSASELARRFSPRFALPDNLARVAFVDADLDAGAEVSWVPIESTLKSGEPMAVAICLPDDKASLYVALELRELLDKKALLSVPIFVHLRRHRRLGEFASKLKQATSDDGRFAVVGSLEQLLSPAMLFDDALDTVAKAVHENYRKSARVGDGNESSMQAWSELAEQYRNSSRRASDHIRLRLMQTGLALREARSPARFEFSDIEVETMARLEHRRWLIERRLAGWSYGPVRDEGKRLNPRLLDWDDQRFHENWRNSVKSNERELPQILARAGLEIVRRERSR